MAPRRGADESDAQRVAVLSRACNSDANGAIGAGDVFDDERLEPARICSDKISAMISSRHPAVSTTTVIGRHR
jgi:hypothetical protein